MKVSERMLNILPSGTVRMLEKAQELKRSGRDIIDLSVGDPDFDTQISIKEVACDAIREGFTHYTSSRGILELREAICGDLKKRGVIADPIHEILITPGTKHALYCSCLATLNPNDEVLILSPSWPTHYTCVQAAGGKPIHVPTYDNYGFNEEAVKLGLSTNSKMILINSPNNPTGGGLSKSDIKAISEFAIDHDLLVISDEVYDRITYDNFKPVSIASLEGMKERTITLNGFSKTYAMTGWRLGYAATTREIISAMQTIQQATTTCPTSFVQKAGLEALNGSQDYVEHMVKEYDVRRRAIVKRLNEIPKVTCKMPKGAFYVFPDFSENKISSIKLVEELLEKKGVNSTPGSAFGVFGEGHIRFSYSTSLPIIMKAMDRIEDYIKA
jgi:aspartate/methionine/tyrosine aminotransferase